jgi:hypothetical protein
LVGVGFLYGGNVLALQVLRHGHFGGGLVRNMQDDSRNFGQFCHKGGTIPALSENNLEAVGVHNGAHADRLQYSLLTNTLGQFGKARLVKVLAWVIVARLNIHQCN